MRLNTVKALMYREFYMVKGKIKGTAVSIIAMSVLSILVLLSFYYGNIGKYLGEVMGTEMTATTEAGDTTVLTADDIKDMVISVLAIFAKIYPILICGFLVAEVGNAAAQDERKTWQYFYRSTPATPLEKSAATYLLVLIFDLVGIALSFAFAGIVTAITGIPLCIGDITVITAALAVGNVFCVLFHLGIKLFHSPDKAGIVIFATAFVAIIGGTGVNTLMKGPVEARREAQELENQLIGRPAIESFYNGLAEKVLPIAIPAAILAPIIGFAVYYLICKRREK